MDLRQLRYFATLAETLNFHLNKGQRATFHYRIVIAAGDRRLSTDRINVLAEQVREAPRNR